MPPAPPHLSVLTTTSNAITLAWNASGSADGGSPLLAYHLHYHREFGDWDRVEVLLQHHHRGLRDGGGPGAADAVENNYTFRTLKCGTKYQFYIQVSSFRSLWAG